MDSETGVIEPEVEDVIGTESTETEQPELETEAGAAETQTTETEKPEDAHSTPFLQKMRAATRQWEKDHPEMANFARQARESHARIVALSQIEPRGVSGVRETYDLLNSLSWGESKGAEAVSAMREELDALGQVDNMLASGDPKAFDALGKDFDQGLAKLAPTYLERVRQVAPEAFEGAILPYLVGTLASSDLIKDFNALVDVIGAQNDPRFDEKTKLQFAYSQLGKMAKWLNELGNRAGEIKAAPTGHNQPNPIETERAELEKERQNLHWERNIKPQAVQHENQTFDRLFAPYQKRLKLNPEAREALMNDFKTGLSKAGNSDAQYMQTMKFYRGQKAPDPAAVANTVRAAINKHAGPVMETLIKARYGAFLSGKAKPAITANGNGQNSAKPIGPVPPNVEIRRVKPPMSEIDHRRTPVEWLAMRQYRLTNGKVIRVVAQ